MPLKTVIFRSIALINNMLKHKIHCHDREASRKWYRLYYYTPNFFTPPSLDFILIIDNDKKRRHCCLLIITLYELI